MTKYRTSFLGRLALTLVVVYAVVLLGCNGRPNAADQSPCGRVTSLWLDPNFSPDEIGAINDAADAWSRATPECWRPADTYSSADVRILYAPTQAEILDSHPLNTVGLWAPHTRRIWITRQDRTLTEIRTIASHEFGHYLGLEHNEIATSCTSVMAPMVQSDFPMGPRSDVPPADVHAYWVLHR